MQYFVCKNWVSISAYKICRLCVEIMCFFEYNVCSKYVGGDKNNYVAIITHGNL